MAIRELSATEATTPIPDVKKQAILALFNQILLTTGDEASRIVDQIRGRRRSLPLTFGELRNMAYAQKLANQAAVAGVEDLGEAPTDLARVLQHITPDLAVCEECSKFPIAEIGGVVSLLTQGRCPHCGQGLITAPKQAEPYLAWTTLEMVSPSQTHDRQTVPHTPLPLSNATIEAEAGKGLFKINDVLSAVMVDEGLTLDDQPDFAKFLVYLAHGPLASRFRAMDEVIRSLGNSSAFGGHDPLSIRAIVRSAKSWTPSAAPAAVAASPGSMASPTFSGTAKRLEDLIMFLFTEQETTLLISRLSDGDNLRLNLPPSNTRLVFSGETVDMLRRQGRIDTELFDAILAARPDRRADILACREKTIRR